MRKLLIYIAILLMGVPCYAAQKTLLDASTAYEAFEWADDNFDELYGASSNNITVDLEDDGGDDTTALDEIAPQNDTNTIFSVTGNKLSIDVSQNWPTADSATTANTANSATSATTATTANNGDSATGFFSAGAIEIAYGGTGQSTAQAAINALTAVSGATDEYVYTKDTATGNAMWKANPGAGAGTVDTTGVVNADEIAVWHDADTLKALTGGEFQTAYAFADYTGTINANEYARWSDANTLEARTTAEMKTDMSLDSVENTAISTWAGTTNVTTLGAISTGSWAATDIPITAGGTGQSTAQAAIDALTQVSGATNEHVLTKDTATGNAIWKAAQGAGSGTVDTYGTPVDNDFAKFTDADTIEGRSYSETRSDLSVADISGTINANEYAQFSDSDTLIARTAAEARSDLSVADISGTINANEYAQFSDADTLIARTAAEVKTDLSLDSVENTAISTWTGSANINTLGTITTGTWNGDDIRHEDGGLEANVAAYSGLVAISGGATSEVDSKSELEAQIADVSDFYEADGDTPTGTHNFGTATLKVENVYANDGSGIILKDDAGTTGLTVLDGAKINIASAVGVGTNPSGAFHIRYGSGGTAAQNYSFLESDDDSGHQLIFDTYSVVASSSATSDGSMIGRVRFDWHSHVSTFVYDNETYPRFEAYVTDNTAATEDTTMRFTNLEAGAVVYPIEMDGSLVGINMTNPSVELDVTGDIEYTGTITDVSDRRLKENIEPILDPLGILELINGVYFNMIGDDRREAGVIAQDVQRSLPEAVKEMDENHLGVSYDMIIPVLVEAVKEQQKQIAALRERVAELEKRNDT